MVQDAEKHAEEDSKKEELIKTRNEADHLAFTTEKTLKEHADKISEEEKKDIEGKIEALRNVISGESVEAISKAKEDLMSASHKLAEEMYKQAQAQQAAAGPQPDAKPGGAEAGDESAADTSGAVDADFEVVDDDKQS
jgi:molecular chaperone DnaK